MSILGPMMPLGGDGAMLCARLPGTDLLLAMLTIALILLRPELVQDADAAAI